MNLVSMRYGLTDGEFVLLRAHLVEKGFEFIPRPGGIENIVTAHHDGKEIFLSGYGRLHHRTSNDNPRDCNYIEAISCSDYFVNLLQDFQTKLGRASSFGDIPAEDPVSIF